MNTGSPKNNNLGTFYTNLGNTVNKGLNNVNKGLNSIGNNVNKGLNSIGNNVTNAVNNINKGLNNSNENFSEVIDENIEEVLDEVLDEIIDEKLNPITDLYIFDVYLAGNGFIANLQYDDFENNKKYIYTKLGTSVSILKKWIKDIKNNMKFKSESYVNDGKTLFSIDSENISIGNLSIKI